MAKKRDQIKMSAGEVATFLNRGRIANIATYGHDGWPHLTALWYVMRESDPWIWTYAKSQKVRNLERDDRATLLVEAGTAYHELRGVMLKTRAQIHRDTDDVLDLAEELFAKYEPASTRADNSTREALRGQAVKRVAIRFHVEQTVSWDHAKLGGAY